MFLTTIALANGLRHFRHGDFKESNRMMKARVGLQGFAVACLLGGVLLTSYKTK